MAISRTTELILDSLPNDDRTRLANEHSESLRAIILGNFPLKDVVKSTRGMTPSQHAYWSFLEGWDAAMKKRLPAISSESLENHNRLMSLMLLAGYALCDQCEDGIVDTGDGICQKCQGNGFVSVEKNQ